jgi:hypothetical protein
MNNSDSDLINGTISALVTAVQVLIDNHPHAEEVKQLIDTEAKADVANFEQRDVPKLFLEGFKDTIETLIL